MVPDATAVTTPVALIVAINGFEETHGFATAGGEALDNEVVNPTQTSNVPVIVDSGLTVMVSVSVQPLVSVNVIIVVPTETPVTTPVEFTVAIEESEETHAFTIAGVDVLDNMVVWPWQTFNVPVTTGNALTVIFSVLVQVF